MEIKSFNEVKAIIEKFPEASGVGFVIFPRLAMIADKLGLPGYDDVLEFEGNLEAETVYAKGIEIPKNANGVFIVWEGLPLIRIENGWLTHSSHYEY